MTTTLQRNAQQQPQSSSHAAGKQHDEFDSDAFEHQRQSLPYLQLLNHQDPDQSGFFIPSENAEAVSFTPTPEWLPHTAAFQNGSTVEGYRSLLARFLILHSSPLLMFERESGEFIGSYRKAQYQRSSMVLKRRYLVFLISQDKRLLHSSPLLLTAKGAFCGSFGQTVEQFRHDMSKAYSAATGAKQPRGERFMALSILAVRLQPQLKGQTKQSWVCSVSEYGVPTVENWQAFFIGYRVELKQQILAQYDEWASFGSLEREFASQRQVSPAEASVSQGQAENFEEFDYGYPEAI
ncbi:MAG: hypothetical protein KME07_13060 [Pegethrix bostrychoides GSE-TBD4-15B]|jgi:hypothetical protein|uniref:DUF5895 domain-containing protein n=1 Tax=Pegethrix bostrychoides GSE-TBD4-15B TaxID=2839662 RepID=A0A951U534_9CYAN|nr:hypothetical protein [Pegethrix bostrychoides GSE-TBD4-15B]